MTASPQTATRNLSPLPPQSRIDQIDILRGLALFGVLAINLLSEFRVSIFEQFIPNPPPTYLLDRWIETYIPIFIELKAFALFSLLFGVGLAIQFDRIRSRGGTVAKLLTRRLLALLLLGVIHLTLIWNGDILVEYAIAGLIAVPFLFLPKRWLAVCALLFALRYIFPFPAYPISFPSEAWLRLHLIAAAQVYKHGTFTQILSFEWHELPELLPLHIFVLPRTIALFLFGALSWRSGMLQHPADHKKRFLTIGLTCFVIGLTLTLLTSQIAPHALFGSAQQELTSIGEITLTLGYAGLIIFFASTKPGFILLKWAAPLGKMAFTNYLMQSVIFSFLFFGWGLGLFGMRSAAALLIGVSVYVLQVLLSAAWLRRFRFGPVEWLWRTMMYGKAQPFRLARAKPPKTTA